jgi:hypothetical protein
MAENHQRSGGRIVNLTETPETKERVYHIEVPIMARLAIAAENKQDAGTMAAELLGAGKRVQAVTGDGIPFTARVL